MDLRYARVSFARARARVYARTTDLLLHKALNGVDAPPAPAGQVTERLRVERIGQEHAEELVALRMQPDSWNPGQAANMLEHLRRGYQGFVIRRGERAVGHFWWIDKRIAPAHPHLVEYEVPLEDGDVYGFEFFVAPGMRGGVWRPTRSARWRGSWRSWATSGSGGPSIPPTRPRCGCTSATAGPRRTR